MRYTAGDVYAARRELGNDRNAEWPLYIEWRARTRAGELEGVPFDAWLDTIPASEMPELIDKVNDGLEPDPEAGTSSDSQLAAV